MSHKNREIRYTPSRVKNKNPRQLRWHHLFLLKIANFVIRLWTRTLRFKLSDEAREIIASNPPPVVAVLWHNRLLVMPEFYRRYVHKRRLATVISASSAGAWLSGLLGLMGIKAIRGSRNRRGPQAYREMLEANKSGFDVGITPDGSRGPMYEMKAGAVSLALRTGTAIVLLSYNFQNAFRLKTWDRFYIPYPFSCVEVDMKLIKDCKDVLGSDVEQAGKELKAHLDGMTRDDNDDDFNGVVV